MADIDKETGEIIETTEPQTAMVTSLGDTMTTKSLQASVNRSQEQRTIISKYVKDHLVKGTDYGTIGSFKKDVLFKPGQEKIFSLMNLTSRLEKDDETLSMLGNEPGVIAYLCRVYRRGEEVAQGRGACKVGENGRDINTAIKIAEKRARMDACLSLGFSEFFTQDLDDKEYGGGNASSKSNVATPKQKQFIMDLFKQVGITDVIDCIKANGVAEPKDMTFDQASELITKLKAGTYARPDKPIKADEPVEGEIVDDGPAGSDARPMETESRDLGPIGKVPIQVVDDQFKRDVKAKIRELGISAKDELALYRRVTEQPMTPKTDMHWIAVDEELNRMATQ